MDNSPSNAKPPPSLPRVLIFAPTGNDAQVTGRFLVEAGHRIAICGDMSTLCREAEVECDVILLAEETLNEISVGILGAMLSRQPPWSDIPLTIITSGGEASSSRLTIFDSIGTRANMSLLERPFRRGTLLSTVAVAEKARQRQLQVKNLLEERENTEARLEQVVKERTVELTETNEQLETLVYSIAHDLRAPLRAMQAFAKILLEDYAPRLDADAQHYASRIVRSAEIMDGLVLDLLAYGKAARSQLEIEPVDLEVSWQYALSLFESDISASGATITTIRPLPWVQASPATLNQVLANLLGNALKFTSPGSAPVITFKAEVHGEMVRASVEDNGIGIAPEYHEKIFRVFERLQKNDGDGTGIGLALVRKGVERMGGKVGLASGFPKKGSLFWIELKKTDKII